MNDLTVTVDFYKETGKWSHREELKMSGTHLFVFETEKICGFIEEFTGIKNMTYTFEAVDGYNAMNKRLVIKF
jgi:predicted enzyme related to lactoylglutathione lyase